MYSFAKRLFDILASTLAILILSPVFLIIIIAIRRGSRGPAIFKQIRAGKDGIPFTFYKFRTMKIDVNPFGASPKSGQDPRLTKTGIFLREYSLDELPQLFNVLKGNMSLVGPRPLYLEQMAEWDTEQKKRLLVKPGLTGLAQISGRAELTREEKLAYDVEYVRKASFFMDLKIIFLTIWQVFTRKSIYEKKYSQTEETRGQGSKNS
ncbi:MAG: sugar transferase [Sedimentisphaerales bacterium]|jgi:lipopolysaccharide/colanic/teichoic acid biosynthesis glycosyltransferase